MEAKGSTWVERSEASHGRCRWTAPLEEAPAYCIHSVLGAADHPIPPTTSAGRGGYGGPPSRRDGRPSLELVDCVLIAHAPLRARGGRHAGGGGGHRLDRPGQPGRHQAHQVRPPADERGRRRGCLRRDARREARLAPATGRHDPVAAQVRARSDTKSEAKSNLECNLRQLGLDGVALGRGRHSGIGNQEGRHMRNQSSRAGIAVAVIVAAVAVACTPAGPKPEQMADAIYGGGDIVTVNDAQPTVEALAVKDGKILADGCARRHREGPQGCDDQGRGPRREDAAAELHRLAQPLHRTRSRWRAR